MNQIEQRITQLEKSLKMYRVFFSTSVIILIAVVLMSSGKKADVPDLIKAKAFQVVDNNGNVLLTLNKEKGNGNLSSYTSSGKRLVSLFTAEGGGGAINTFDTDGDVMFKVTRTTEGGGYLALYNGRQQEVAELGVTTGETGYFNLNDRNGDKIAWMTFTENGGGYFSLWNNSTETIRLSTPSAGGRIGVYNKTNTRVGYMGTQESQDGNITIWNSNGSRTGGVPN